MLEVSSHDSEVTTEKLEALESSRSHSKETFSLKRKKIKKAVRNRDKMPTLEMKRTLSCNSYKKSKHLLSQPQTPHNTTQFILNSYDSSEEYYSPHQTPLSPYKGSPFIGSMIGLFNAKSMKSPRVIERSEALIEIEKLDLSSIDLKHINKNNLPEFLAKLNQKNKEKDLEIMKLQGLVNLNSEFKLE